MYGDGMGGMKEEKGGGSFQTPESEGRGGGERGVLARGGN